MKRTKKEFKDYNDYHDRPFGLKWGTAFALEELSQAININKHKATHFEKELPIMARDAMDQTLQLAFLKQKKVSIQTINRDELGNLGPSITGKFEGLADESNLYLGMHVIPWITIRNIQIIE